MIFSHVLYQLSYLACREIQDSGPAAERRVQKPEYNMQVFTGTLVENAYGRYACAR